MASRNILKDFSQYQRARIQFCEAIAEYALKPTNVAILEENGAIELILPLITDRELSVRLSATCCLGRMASNSIKIATTLVEKSAPQYMLRELIDERNNHILVKRAILQSLKSMAKHTPELANQIVQCGGLSAFLVCLEEQDVMIKEEAACGIGCCVKQSKEIANIAIHQGVLTLLVMCLQHHELSLKLVAACVLADIAIHSPSHSQAICEAGALSHLSKCLDNIDVRLKKNCLAALGNIAGHNIELAEKVIEADIFPKVLIYLGHDSKLIQKQGARLVRDIVKHSLELAQIVVNLGGIGALVQLLMLSPDDKDIVTHTAYAIGYIAGQSPHFALAVIESKGVVALSQILSVSKSDDKLSATVWALGHIAKHSPEHSRSIAESNGLRRILEIYENEKITDELKNKCKCALKMSLQCCLELPALEPLLYSAPPEILKYILGQFSKVLPKDATARRLFITTGGLKKVQEIEFEENSLLGEYIEIINSCFPDDIVKFFAPGFNESILERMDQFIPENFNLKDDLSTDSCADIFKANLKMNKENGDGKSVKS